MRTKSPSAFDWGRSKNPEPVSKEKARKFPVGMVRKMDIQTLPQLAAEFKLAGGGPLDFIDNKGKHICRIFSASTEIQGKMPELHLNKMLENAAYHLGRAGDEGVIRIIKKGRVVGDLGAEEWVTVAFFAGKDFRPEQS